MFIYGTHKLPWKSLWQLPRFLENTGYQDDIGFQDDEKNDHDLLTFWLWGSDQDDELLANIPSEFIELAGTTDAEEFESNKFELNQNG